MSSTNTFWSPLRHSLSGAKHYCHRFLWSLLNNPCSRLLSILFRKEKYTIARTHRNHFFGEVCFLTQISTPTLWLSFDLAQDINFQIHFKDDQRLKKFELYLKRHIELDGDIHSHLAKKLVASICRSEKEWELAENSALTAIKSRFDSIKNRLSYNKSIFKTHILGQRFFCYQREKTEGLLHQLWSICNMRSRYWKSCRCNSRKMRSRFCLQE